MRDSYDVMLELVQSAHAGQYRNNGKVPYWHHCRNVATILRATSHATMEIIDDELLDDMLIAALGHDLVEDTSETEASLRTKFSPRVVDMIVTLTNHDGDHDTKRYLKTVSNASEEVRLVKYCDLIDNLQSVVYGLHDLGTEWASDFSGLLPNLPMIRYKKLTFIPIRRCRKRSK